MHRTTKKACANADLSAAQGTEVSFRLFDPRQGGVPFKTEALPPANALTQPQRFNLFTILWIQEGCGIFHADLAEYSFRAPALLFFNPYQTFFLLPESSLRGVSLQFHANFLCIETHHEAIGCNGVLFNDLYGEPQVRLPAEVLPEFTALISDMRQEFSTAGVAHSELLLSYLKVLLIKATRLKIEQQKLAAIGTVSRPPVLEQFIQLIEQHYQSKHSPAEYAALLHITPKALGRLVKLHFRRTPTELIRERVLKHAKWQLLHTRRPIKEIAFEVGFADELYFSRLFKRATGCSPAFFRDFETAIRGGSNLSM